MIYLLYHIITLSGWEWLSLVVTGGGCQWWSRMVISVLVTHIGSLRWPLMVVVISGHW